MLIPVILVNYNNIDDTIDCIKSLKKSTHVDPYIIVVDNHSSDRDRISELEKEFSELKVILNDENLGFGKANNIGIEWAFKNLEFEYILLQNNDTIIQEDTLINLVKPFDTDPEIGITTGKIYYFEPSNIIWYGGGVINYNRGWPRITDFNTEATTDGANKSRYVSFISGCTMMFSRKCLQDLKGFDPDFFMYCEDLELCIRAQKSGYKLYYESDSVIFHKVQGSLKDSEHKNLAPKSSNLPFLFYHLKSNQWITMRKHFKGIQFLKFNIFFWAELILKTVRYVFYGRFIMISTFFRIVKRIIKS